MAFVAYCLCEFISRQSFVLNILRFWCTFLLSVQATSAVDFLEGLVSKMT